MYKVKCGSADLSLSVMHSHCFSVPEYLSKNIHPEPSASQNQVLFKRIKEYSWLFQLPTALKVDDPLATFLFFFKVGSIPSVEPSAGLKLTT